MSFLRRSPTGALALAGACALILLSGANVRAGEAQAPGHDHTQHGHGGHQHAAEKAEYRRTTHAYTLPDVMMVREDGTRVRFADEMDDGRPAVLNFIYTTCTAICPLLSQTFADFQSALGPDALQVHMVSVSIDPEQDTPARLTEYAKRFNAGPQWNHYTGSREASIQVQKALQAYTWDKMNHRPLTFLRRAPGTPWVRLDGFTTPDELVREYRTLLAAG